MSSFVLHRAWLYIKATREAQWMTFKTLEALKHHLISSCCIWQMPCPRCHPVNILQRAVSNVTAFRTPQPHRQHPSYLRSESSRVGLAHVTPSVPVLPTQQLLCVFVLGPGGVSTWKVTILTLRNPQFSEEKHLRNHRVNGNCDFKTCFPAYPHQGSTV